jgi:hypothetical protein
MILINLINRLDNVLNVHILHLYVHLKHNFKLAKINSMRNQLED